MDRSLPVCACSVDQSNSIYVPRLSICPKTQKGPPGFVVATRRALSQCMCAEARQRSQIGASRRNTGCHEPPSATSLICAAHRAAGRLSRSACVRVRPAGTGCIAGVSCRAAAPSSCSNRSNSGFSACFGTCPSLSTSADLHTSRSAGSQGRLPRVARCQLYHVNCSARRRSADWWIGLSMGGDGQVSAAQTGALGSSLIPHFLASTSHLCLCLHPLGCW